MAKTESSQWFEIIRFFDFRRDASIQSANCSVKTQDSPPTCSFPSTNYQMKKTSYRERTERSNRGVKKFSHDIILEKGCQLIQNGNHDDDVRLFGLQVFLNNYDEMREFEKSSVPWSIPFSSVNEVNTYDGLAFYEFLRDMNSISCWEWHVLVSSNLIEALTITPTTDMTLQRGCLRFHPISEETRCWQCFEPNGWRFLPHVLIGWKALTRRTGLNAEVFMKLLKIYWPWRPTNQHWVKWFRWAENTS